MDTDWAIDERRHAGEEHVDPEQVAYYDEKIPFDPRDEVDLLREWGLSAEDTVVDLGTGTGVFPAAVAEHCERVVAVDVSPAMLDAARDRLRAAGIDDVELVESGMVEYEHGGDPAGVVFSKNALHHLPDFWKLEALQTVARTLEPGGIFRLRDLVYSFDPWESHGEIESWLDGMADSLFTDEELHAHFREEFSTYDFLFEPMLERVGFEIHEANYERGFYADYVCEWPGREG